MIITPDFSYTNGTHFAQLSELAYEKSPDEVKRKMAPKGYRNVRYFDKSGAQCYGLEAEDHVVLAFRGTEPTTMNDVKADINIFHGQDKYGITVGNVHKGFRNEVDTLWPDIKKWLRGTSNKQVYTCGHSLGGAMSGIAASRIDNAICYNYGCPRIGTKDWAKEFDKSHKMYRFVNDRDVISKIPPKWMNYKHCGELHHITRKGKIKKNPTKWSLFKNGFINMLRNPLRIVQGIPDHDMGDYRTLIRRWSESDINNPS